MLLFHEKIYVGLPSYLVKGVYFDRGQKAPEGSNKVLSPDKRHVAQVERSHGFQALFSYLLDSPRGLSWSRIDAQSKLRKNAIYYDVWSFIMHDLPFISIITPTLNQAKYIETTILSVLIQDYPKLEHIIIDGGSTDGSIELIKSYQNRLAWWMSVPGLGQTDALNKGLQNANGEIIGWINSDDFYLPGSIKAVAHFFAKHPEAIIVYGDFYEINGSGYFLRHVRPGIFNLVRLFHRCYISQMTVFFRQELIESIGKFNDQFMYAHDYDLWLRSGLAYSDKIYYLSQPLACYRIHAKSQSWAKALPARIEDITVRELFLKANKLPQELLNIQGDIFIDLWMDIIIFYVTKSLQIEVQSYLCEKLGNNILTDNQWITLRRFLSDVSCSDFQTDTGIAALVQLLKAWHKRYGNPATDLNDVNITRWISELMIRLGNAHFKQTNAIRTLQFVRLAIGLYPAVLLQKRTLLVIFKLTLGKKIVGYLRSLIFSVHTIRHQNLDEVIYSLARRFS